MTRIAIYDTTLRDGMQGHGMSLSVEEKVRVAHVLDDLGIPFIEAGFPASNPKEAELFARLEHEGLRADVCAFGMTRRRDTRADDDPALRDRSPSSFAPVCTLVGKTWSLHLEKVVKVGRDENLAMIADSVAFLVAQGKRVIYDAEHFFDGWRDDPAYALACLQAAAARRRRERHAVRHQRRVAARARSPPRCATSSPRVDAPIGIHCHNDAECGVANSLAAVAEGAVLVQGTMNGYGERCGNANLTSIVPNLQLKLGHDCLPTLEGWTEAAHYLDELLNLTPDPNQPYVGKNAFAHKGGMHVAGVNADPATFEHIDPAAVGNSREVLVSELSGKGTVIAHAGGALDDATATRVVERVKELEHRGFQFEAADGSFDLLIRRETGDYEPLFRLESWRVISEKREDGRVQTEATIKIWVDGQRYVRVAEGNGPVNALDTRAARRDRRALSAPARHQARQLQGPHPRRVEGDRRHHARAARRHRRHRHLGRDRRARERDRGELGRAGRLARGGHGPHAGAPSGVDPDSRSPSSARRRSRRSLEVLRSGQLSLGPRVPEFERAFAARVGARHASAVSSGTAALHLGAARGRRERRRRGRHVAVLVRRLGQRDRLRARHARCSPTSTRSRSTSTPTRRRPRSPAARTALLPVHIFGYPADVPALERHGLPIVEDACEALGAVHADGTPVGGRGHPAAFAFYANKQLTTGEGGMLTMGSAEHKERVDSERNQGRAPDMGWLDHDRLGFNYRLTDIACALGLAQLERLDGMLADRARVAGWYREALAGTEVGAAVRGRRRRRARLVRVRRPGPARVDRDGVIGALRERGVQSKPYLPAIHLMSFYRERVRPPRGRVPGLRGRRRALGRAAVLPAR